MARLRWAAAISLVVALIVGGVALYNSSLFTIDSVVVEGATELTPAEVIETAALPDGATLIRYPRAEMESRLVAHPWISAAHISRRLPDTLVVHVEERTPAALVDVGTAEFWLVDRTGVVLGARSPETTETVTVVRDLTDFEPVAGERADSDALANALLVIEGLSDELRSLVRAVSAPSVDLTMLITRDDIEILVGSAEEIEEKDAVARQIMAEQGESIVHINVRTVDRPTWRGIDAGQ